ncbi:lymphocyte antigen 6H-like isoform X2 [Macrotis lagotis]
MKILISVLLGTILFVESAHCKKCFQCYGVNDLNLCKVKQCRSGEYTCAKVVVTTHFEFKKSYFMDCATSCEDFKKSFLDTPSHGFKMDVSCCATELCNGMSRVRGNPWALAGAFLLSLIPAILWAGL